MTWACGHVGGIFRLCPGSLCEVPGVLYSVPPKHGPGDFLLFLPWSSRPEGTPSLRGTGLWSIPGYHNGVVHTQSLSRVKG